jgi:hypothetical protein
MSVPTTTFRGVIHGKTIELDQESGLPDGQQVTVVVGPARAIGLAPGEGLRRSAGAWADDAEELDVFLLRNRPWKKSARYDLTISSGVVIGSIPNGI